MTKEELSKLQREESVLLQWSLEGIAVKAVYQDMELVALLLEDGSKLPEENLSIKGLPHTIPWKSNMVVYGTLVMKVSAFEQINTFLPYEEKFYNMKNLIWDTVHLAKEDSVYGRPLEFFAYRLDIGKELSLERQFSLLEKLFFLVMPWRSIPGAVLRWELSNWTRDAKQLDYPVNGMLLSSKGQGPLFYSWEEETARTKLTSLEWITGRGGVVIPYAVFEPVSLEGETCFRLSLGNASKMRCILGKPYAGQPLQIHKNQDSFRIRSIEIREEPERCFLVPRNCPCCKAPLIRKRSKHHTDYLLCKNTDCPSRELRRFVTFCGEEGLGISLSSELLEELLSKGYLRELPDLFELNQVRRNLEEEPGWTADRVDSLLSAIEQGRACKVADFLSGLGIPRLQKAQIKLLLKEVENRFETDVCKELYGETLLYQFLFLLAEGYDFSSLKGVDKEALSFLSSFLKEPTSQLFFEEEENWLSRLLLLLQFTDIPPKELYQKHKTDLEEKEFASTGPLRYFSSHKELAKAIQESGGRYTNRVGRNTDYLVTNNPTLQNEKIKRASELGIPFLPERQLIRMLRREEEFALEEKGEER